MQVSDDPKSAGDDLLNHLMDHATAAGNPAQHRGKYAFALFAAGEVAMALLWGVRLGVLRLAA